MDVPKKKAEGIINAIFSSMAASLQRRENIKIPKFGTFKVVALTYYPYVTFHPSKVYLKKVINDNYIPPQE